MRRCQFAQEGADGPAEVEAAAALLAAPERHHGRRPLGRDDQHAVGLDALDTPGVGAEQESIADAAFVDELLIQFADADGRRRRRRTVRCRGWCRR